MGQTKMHPWTKAGQFGIPLYVCHFIGQKFVLQIQLTHLGM